MMSGFNDFKDDIDWGVFKGQQTPVAPPAGSAPPQQTMADYQESQTGRSDVPLGKPPRDESDMVDTFLGKMPRHMPEFQAGTPENKKMLEEMINGFAGGPGIKMVGEVAIPAAKAAIGKGIEYLHPERAAEKFRSMIGEGTSKENIDVLGKRVQYAKGTAKEEAMIPKRELYSQEGKSNVYNVKPENLPEGNIPQMAHMIAPGEQFGEAQSKALSKAIADYRKTGSVDSFLEKSEDIFNIPELSPKAASRIEDVLDMPIKRDSAYFADKDVDALYGKGKLQQLHDTYEQKPILANYDKLQSALGKRIRKLEAKGKNLDDAGETKLEAFKTNKERLVADKENFMGTLPEKMQNLETEFRTKYATGVGKYESAPLAMRKLAEGKSGEVTPAQVAKLFTNPTAETLGILKDLGPSAGKNILYNALQKVPINDAEGMANTILDLKRTKGYDQFIDEGMERWANNMLKHVGRANLIKKSLGSAAGAIGGSAIFGPVGGVVGAAAPWGKQGVKYLAEKFKK